MFHPFFNFLQCTEREQRSILSYYYHLCSLVVDNYFVIVIGQSDFLEVIDRMTDRVQVFDTGSTLSIIYHAIPYQGNSFFLLFRNELRLQWYGVVIGDFNEDFNFNLFQ